MLMRFGPFNSAYRFQQCREGFQEYLAVATPHDCPVFLEALPRLLRGRDRGEYIVQEGIAELIWCGMQEDECWTTAGSPPDLARWFHLLKVGREDDVFWNSRYVGQLCTARV